jgi:hypothetical protein
VRLELRDEQWAELRDRLTYGQAREVRVAYIGAGGTGLADLDMAFVRAYVADWRVLSLEGAPLSIDRATDAPDDIIQAIAEKCLAIWNGSPDPKGTNGSSPSLPLVQRVGSTTKER